MHYNYDGEPYEAAYYSEAAYDEYCSLAGSNDPDGDRLVAIIDKFQNIDGPHYTPFVYWHKLGYDPTDIPF